MIGTRWVRNPRVAWQLIEGEAVLVNLVSGDTLGLNETGGFIWSNLDEMPPARIAAALAAQHGITDEAARADVDEFLSLLLREGLVSTKGAA